MVGGYESGTMYAAYASVVTSHLSDASPLVMTAEYGLTGLNGTIVIDIEVDQTVTTSDNAVRIVVFEDSGSAYVNLARLALDEIDFDLTTPGEAVQITRTFTLDSSWALENVGVAVFVQSGASGHEVLQACTAVADYAGTVVVDVEPDGLEAGWLLEGPSGFAQARRDDASMEVFAAGSYTLTWQPVEGWTKPSPAQQTLVLAEGGEITFSAQYTGGPFTGRSDGVLGEAGYADQGVSLRDLDGDGDLDIAVACLDGEDRLLLNGPGAAFTLSSETLPGGSGPTVHLAWGDLDNDGAPDLYAAREDAANAVLRNDGTGTFTDVSFGDVADAGTASGASWIDTNGDGRLDLHLVNTDAEDKLFLNYGQSGDYYVLWPQSGFPSGAGVSAAWADYDADGDPDYYLVRSYEANELFESSNGSFWEANVPEFLRDTGGGVGAAWGDYDNDGDLDLYLTNDGSLDRLYRQTSTSWSLATGGALADEGCGRGVAWGDLDNDGDLDLYIARHGEYDRFLRNDAGVFVAVPLGIDACAGHANGCALGDVDGDGDLDVYVANDGDANVLLINELGAGNHWLHIDLVGDDCNRDAVGARVRAVAGGLSQIRFVDGGSGYRSQDSPTVEFGFGATAMVDTLVVTWPCGNEETYTNVGADRRITLVENQDTDAPPALEAAVLRLWPARPNPFNPRTEIRFELATAGRTHLAVYDLAGRRVCTLIDAELPAGPQTATWSGVDDAGRVVAAGTYLLRLRQGERVEVRRVSLVK